MKVTKTAIDKVSDLYLTMTEAKKVYDKAQLAYDDAIQPVLDYIDKEMKLPPEKAAHLKGHHSVIDIGKRREVRTLTDPVEALRRLEAVEQGLGYANIKLALNVLQKNLAERDYADLLAVSYGKRNVKATKLD